MRSALVVIPGRLPGWNEYVAVERRNRFAGAKMKKDTSWLVAFYARKARLEPFVGPVVVRIRWVEPNRRRDVDNVQGASKFVLDGLRDAGVIVNDTQKRVRHVEHLPLEVDKAQPRVEVEIVEVVS